MPKQKQFLPPGSPENTEELPEEITISETVLLENIHEIRFVDKDGLVYRLDGIPGHARGDYRLVKA